MTAATAGAATFADLDASRAVLIEYQDSWNRHDIVSMEELFADDAHWINIVGMHWQGRAAIIAAHDAFHRAMFRNTELNFIDISIRAITPNVAAAVVEAKVGCFTTPDGTVRPSARNRLSFILTKRDRSWRIAHGHNTVVDPTAERFDPVNSGGNDALDKPKEAS